MEEFFLRLGVNLGSWELGAYLQVGNVIVLDGIISVVLGWIHLISHVLVGVLGSKVGS